MKCRPDYFVFKMLIIMVIKVMQQRLKHIAYTFVYDAVSCVVNNEETLAYNFGGSR